MGNAFERMKAGLEDAIEYAGGDTKGRRQPDRSARLLLMVIDKHPDVVEEALVGA